MTASRTSTWRRPGRAVALGLAVLLTGVLALTGTLLGGERPAIAVASPPASATPTLASASASPSATPTSPPIPSKPTVSATPGGTVPEPTAPVLTVPVLTPSPPTAPVRVAIDIMIGADPAASFAHQLTKTWCAPAAVQMALAVLGLADTSADVQRRIQGRIGEWESRTDSRNLRWGPAAIQQALAAYGATGYEVRVHATRQAALADAARSILLTSSPVVLLAWRGAHAWVMTGFRADADPLVFPDATIHGGYILDPWYPSVSSIWGPSDPPGTFQDAAEMARNYLPWKRPEGRYPDRDGRFIAVVPTIAAGSGE